MTMQSDVRVFVTADQGSAAERAWWCRGFGAPDVRWADAMVGEDGAVRLFDDVAGRYVHPVTPPERIVSEAQRLAGLVRAGTHRVVGGGWVEPA